MTRNLNETVKEISRDNAYLNVLFYSAITIFTVLAILHIFNSFGYFMDELEHIHASFLISKGAVPYRDFFEHHHPLLWYILLPVAFFFERDINIIYATRFIAVFGYLFFLFLFYKTAVSFSTRKAAKISVLSLLCLYLLWRDIQTIRPDIFMYISMFAALINFRDYLNTKKTRYLCFSYMFWLIAFLFLQKTCFPGIGFVFANVWLLYKKQIKLKDMIIACAIPLFVSGVLFFLLYSTNTLRNYWLYNFVYNNFVRTYYTSYSFGKGYLPTLSFISAIIIIRTFKSSSQNIAIFFCWVLSGIQLLYFSPYHQYYFIYMAFSILLLTPIFIKLYNKYFLPFIFVLAVLLFISFYNNYNSYNARGKLHTELNLIDYIMQNTSFEDNVLSYPHAYNLFNKNEDYYWFGFRHAVIIADLFMEKGFDFNEQIKNNKPKFLILSDINFDLVAYANARWLIYRNTNLIQKAARGDKTALSKLSNINFDYWQIDMDYIKQHYRFLRSYNNVNLWERLDD